MLGSTKTRQEIANEYRISRKTLYNWFKEKDMHFNRGLLTSNDQEEIYRTFGIPQLISKEERDYYSRLFRK